MTARQNTRLTKMIKPDMKGYEEKKEKMFVFIILGVC